MYNYDERVFIAEGVRISGAETIEIGEQASIWYNSVIRSSGKPIKIGKRTNIQDGSVVHTCPAGGTYIGDDVTIGHMCLIHGCSIGDRTLIGMGSVVMDEAKIGSECIIGAGSLVTKGTVIPDGCMAFGRPAKVVRELTDEEKAGIMSSAEEYIEATAVEREALK